MHAQKRRRSLLNKARVRIESFSDILCACTLVENSEIINFSRLRVHKRKADVAENFENMAAWENDLLHSRLRLSLGRG